MVTKEKWQERWFQAGLVLFGFLLGLGGTIWNSHLQQSKDNEAIVTFILGSVVVEKRQDDTLREHLREYLPGKNRRLLPDGLDWMHDPTVIMSLGSQVGKLQPEIVEAFNTYLLMVIQCRSARTLFHQRLTNDGRLTEENFLLYSNTLKLVSERAEILIGLLGKYYPVTVRAFSHRNTGETETVPGDGTVYEKKIPSPIDDD